jgi:hypothetical protein
MSWQVKNQPLADYAKKYKPSFNEVGPKLVLKSHWMFQPENKNIAK